MTSEYWLEGMVAVVTGPGQGKDECGSRIARGLARYGAPVSVNDLAKELLQATLDQPPSRGNDTWRIPGNFAAAHSARQVINVLAVHDRQVHLVVSNATVGGLVSAEERLSNAHGHCQIGVDLSDLLSTSRAALTDRIPRRLGHVINIGSLARWRTAFRGLMDTTTKSGLLNLTQHTVSEGASLSSSVGVLLPTGILRPHIFRAQPDLSRRESSCSGLRDSAEMGKLVASPSHRHAIAASGTPLDRRGGNAMRSIMAYKGRSGRMMKVEPTGAIVATDRRRERGHNEFTAIVRP
uniref:SDR family NAD(P)-dependent oxidoreductase n=1 Tax=Thermomicrobium roseum TaxID=500 RepID=A0A7C1G5J9_THERO